MKPALPTLTTDVIADDDALWAAIDEVIRGDTDLRGHQQEVVRRQDALREVVDDDGWAAYLQVENATNARLEEVSLALVRWAYEQGQRFDGQQRGPA